jgi:TonB family protein
MSKLILRGGAFAALVLACGLSASGQETGRGPCEGGIIDGLAASKPVPAYPKKARAARASGTVTVQVWVDEEGKVKQTRVCSGHTLLRAAAVEAAHKARFRPMTFGGRDRPQGFRGVLTYTFVLPRRTKR